MSMKYVIRWKSKVNGRAGRGTKEFAREEGERLVEELNSEYPDIEHELIHAPPPQPKVEQHSEADTSAQEQPIPDVHAVS